MPDILLPNKNDKIALPAKVTPDGLPANYTLSTFLRAFTRHWGTGMTGIASIPCAIAGLVFSGMVAKLSFGILTIGCVMSAAYLVWRDQRKALLQEISQTSFPEFKCTVHCLHIADASPNRRAMNLPGKVWTVNAYRIVVEVSLVNTRNAPCSVQTFKLIVTKKSGEHVATLEPVVPVEKNFILMSPSSPDDIFVTDALTWENALYLMDVVQGRRMEQGAYEKAWLGFELYQTTAHSNDLNFALDLIDGYDNLHHASLESMVVTESNYDVAPKL